MASRIFPVKVVISAIDNARAVIKGVSAAARLAARTSAVGGVGGGTVASAALARAGAAAGASARNIERFGESVRRNVFTRGGLVGGTALYALGKITKGFGEKADELAKFERQTGMSVENLQKIRHSAALAGVEFDDVNNAIEQFSVRLGRAKYNAGAMWEILRKGHHELVTELTGMALRPEFAGNPGALIYAQFVRAMEMMSAESDKSERAKLANAFFERYRMARMASEFERPLGPTVLATPFELAIAEKAHLGIVRSAATKEAEDYVDHMTRIFAGLEGIYNKAGSRAIEHLKKTADETHTALFKNQDSRFYRETVQATEELVRAFGNLFSADKIKGAVNMGLAIKNVGGSLIGMAGGLGNAALLMGTIAASPYLFAVGRHIRWFGGLPGRGLERVSSWVPGAEQRLDKAMRVKKLQYEIASAKLLNQHGRRLSFSEIDKLVGKHVVLDKEMAAYALGGAVLTNALTAVKALGKLSKFARFTGPSAVLFGLYELYEHHDKIYKFMPEFERVFSWVWTGIKTVMFGAIRTAEGLVYILGKLAGWGLGPTWDVAIAHIKFMSSAIGWLGSLVPGGSRPQDSTLDKMLDNSILPSPGGAYDAGQWLHERTLGPLYDWYAKDPRNPFGAEKPAPPVAAPTAKQKVDVHVTLDAKKDTPVRVKDVRSLTSDGVGLSWSVGQNLLGGAP